MITFLHTTLQFIADFTFVHTSVISIFRFVHNSISAKFKFNHNIDPDILSTQNGVGYWTIDSSFKIG